MINQNTKLKVYHNTLDISQQAFDFSRDSFSLTLLSSDYLYVGFDKPINSIYIQINTPNENANTFTAEYYDGSNWVSISNYYDDTKGFTRSGFMSWDRNQSGQSANTVNSVSAYWVRLSCSSDQSATELQAINFVFADDNDLTYEVPEIADTNHLAGKSSHILTHAAVRNQIIQDLNNNSYSKTNQTTGLKEDLTCWDILDTNQLKQAAIFLALSKIYFNFSDSPDDKYVQKSDYYQNQYKKALGLSALALDTNDDGVADATELNPVARFSEIRMKR